MSRVIQIIELVHEIRDYSINLLDLLLIGGLLLLLLLLLLLRRIHLSRVSVHSLLFKLNQVLLIFELSPELISLHLKLLESLLISLIFVHVERLVHAGISLAAFGFRQSCEEAVLIVHEEFSLN